MGDSAEDIAKLLGFGGFGTTKVRSGCESERMSGCESEVRVRGGVGVRVS